MSQGSDRKTTLGQASSTHKQRRERSLAEKKRAQEAHCAASARYREKNHSKVLEAGRVRAAERRARLKHDEEARARAREASARYRAKNREELALKRRQARKRAFIDKHGIHAYIQRRFDAPTRAEVAASANEEEDPDAEALRNFVFYDGTTCPNAPIIISTYEDPLLKRRY